MGRRTTTFHDRQLVDHYLMNLIVADIYELYNEWLRDGDVLAEGGESGHDLIPTPITLRSVPLRSGYDCFEDNAGNLTYVAGEPGRADWIFPPKYQRAPWQEQWFFSTPGQGKWAAISNPCQQKYSPGGWSSDYNFDDSGWMNCIYVSGGNYHDVWETYWRPDLVNGRAQTVMSSDNQYGIMDCWHRLFRLRFAITVPSGMQIERVFLKVWSDNTSWWYCNGTEVVSNVQGPVGPYDLTGVAVEGNNLLTCQLCNDDSGGTNPMGIKYTIQIQFKPTTTLGQQFYAYWAQITGNPDDSPRKGIVIAGEHGISGHTQNNGARFYTYGSDHAKINDVWINAFCFGHFE